ncbi:MAG: phosphate ABC transporter, permease protein PstA [Chromatiales bacterium 21-64-14]|nr:MAG: phosphate ABC transporter, permease protein PstA [Chromatiales bacterium 21-64-14]HQU14621.1 phosphate ABC transporter permease PstA [Gammaproteobacteria bacterium]
MKPRSSADATHHALARIRRRRVFNVLGWTISVLAFVLLALAIADLLYLVMHKGASSLSLDLFTQVTNGIGGGLANAITGTGLLAGGALLLAAPLGIGTGIYLSEFGRGRWGHAVRFWADVLVGVPSIVLGYFGYITMVIAFGWNFSLAAGAITLAIMMVPYIARTTDLALRQVPFGVREAAYALGAQDWRVSLRVVLPAGAPAVLTGILLALAIGMGETAPLLYTAGWSNYLWNGNLTHEPVGYLTYVIWTFINEPFASAHRLAFAAALLITALVLLINVLARLLLTGFSRRLGAR